MGRRRNSIMSRLLGGFFDTIGVVNKRLMAIKLAWEFSGMDDETAKQILDILEKEKRS